MTLSEVLRDIRRMRGMSQGEAAEVMEVTRGAYCNVERGVMTDRTVIRYIKGMGGVVIDRKDIIYGGVSFSATLSPPKSEGL